MSARPGLCGGQPAMVVPTAISLRGCPVRVNERTNDYNRCAGVASWFERKVLNRRSPVAYLAQPSLLGLLFGRGSYA